MVLKAREYRLSPRSVFTNHFCVTIRRCILMHNLFQSHSAAKDQSKAMRPVYWMRVSDDHSRKSDEHSYLPLEMSRL